MDLTHSLSIDTSGFVRPLAEATQATEDSGTRIIRVIHQQKDNWIQFASHATTAAAGLGAVAAAATAAAIPIGAAGAVAVSQTVGWNAVGHAILKYGGIVNSVARIVIPHYRAIGLAVGTALAVYKLANTEMGQNALKAIANNGAVQASFSKLSAEASKLGTSLARPFRSMADVGSAGIQLLVERFSPLPMIAQAVGAALSTSMDFAASAVKSMEGAVTSATDALTALALSMAAGADSKGFAFYYQEAEALRTLAAETERIIGLQQSHASQYRLLRDAQVDAAERAGKAEEISKIGHLMSVQAIDEETRRYQKLFAAQIQNLKAGEQLTAGQKAHLKNVMDALAAQKAGVESGRITEKTVKEKEATGPDNTAAVHAYEQASNALNQLKFGQDEAARMAIAASNATDEEVQALMALHDETIKLRDAQNQQQQADQLFKQGAERIESMKDQVALLEKTATNAQIEMRKMARAGFTQEQIDEVGRLQAKLDGLKEKDKKAKSAGENKASFAGSSETASLILRGVSSPRKTSGEKTLAEQLTVQKQLLAATKKQKGNGQILLAGNISGY